MNKRTIQGTIGVWLSEHSHIGPKELAEYPDDRLIRAVQFVGVDMKPEGWTKVGDATVTFDIPDANTLVEAKVEALRAEKTKTLAAAEAKATDIERQIQTLLAITYEA